MHKKTVAVLFLITICISMTGLFSYAAQKIYGYAKGIPLIKEEFQPVSENAAERPDVSKEMPADVSDNHTTEDSASFSERNPLHSYHEKFNWLKEKIETLVNDKISLRFAYIESYGLLQYIMDKPTVGDIVRLNNRYLTRTQPKVSHIEIFSQNVMGFDAYLQTKNIDFLYVQAPFKISKFDTQLPTGVEDFTNENTDVFLSQIKEAGVNCIDLRQVMHDQGIDPYDMFFKTDHHWTPEAGLWAADVTSEYLNSHYAQKYNISRENFNLQNYDVYPLSSDYIGYYGINTGKIYAGTDTINMVKPDFMNQFTVQKQDKSAATGPFEDVMLDQSVWDINEGGYNRYLYHLYTGVSNDKINLKNTYTDNTARVLLIGESFTCAFAPFFALGVEEVDMLSIGSASQPGEIESALNRVQPDIVIILQSTGNFTWDHAWLDF